MRGKAEPVGTSQNYQRFAWGTLALAAVVALAGTDRGEGAVAAPVTVATAAEAAIPAPKMARPAFAATSPQPAEELDQGDGGGALPDNEPVQVGPSAPGLPGDAAFPALPTAGPANAVEAGRLVSSSQARSGGVAQGDDPVARQLH